MVIAKIRAIRFPKWRKEMVGVDGADKLFLSARRPRFSWESLKRAPEERRRGEDTPKRVERGIATVD